MMSEGLSISEKEGRLIVRLHVLPRAKFTEIAGLHNGALKVKITAPPVDDAANRGIIEFFSSILGIPKSSLKILAGNKSREKLLQITGLSLPDFTTRLPKKPL